MLLLDRNENVACLVIEALGRVVALVMLVMTVNSKRVRWWLWL